MAKFQQHALFIITLCYSILSVVFRWFIGVLISKIFLTSVLGGGTESQIGFSNYFSHLFLESWSFYEVLWALVAVSIILAVLLGLRQCMNQLVVFNDMVDLRGQLFQGMLDFEKNSSGLQDTVMQNLEVVQAFRLNQEDYRRMDIMIFITSVILLPIFSWRSFLIVVAIVVIQKMWTVLVDLPVMSKLRADFQAKQAVTVSRMIDAARVRDLVQVNERQQDEAAAVRLLEHESSKVNSKIAHRSFFTQFVPQTLNILTMPAVCISSYMVMENLEGEERVEEGVALLLVMFTLQELHRALSELIVFEENKIVYDAARADIDKLLASRSASRTAPSSDEGSASESGAVVGAPTSLNSDLVRSTDLQVVDIVPANAPSNLDVKRAAPTLRLDGVSFRYRGATMDSVVNSNVQFDGGVVQAIMGESGGGKSTILKMLMGLLQPTHGQILVDGQPLQRVLPQFRARLGVVAQDSLLFARSVRENLCYGLDADDERRSEDNVRTALQMACLEEVVESLEEGLDTVLADGEHQLSGGQRQRMHLARLFVRNPEVVLMDEPTSALDSETTTKVVDALQGFLVGKTAVIISHHREAVVDRLCPVVHHIEAMHTRARRNDRMRKRSSFARRETQKFLPRTSIAGAAAAAASLISPKVNAPLTPTSAV